MSSSHIATDSPAQLQAILHPESIALIGVSNDPDKTGGRPLMYLRRAGFKGTIYPVNPRRDTVQNERAWPSVRDLPEVPDHAYILTPTSAVIDTVQECADVGVKVVTILASGFSEMGPEGVERENRLRDIAQSTGIRILGPSSLGVVNMHTGLVLTANGAFAEPDMPKGKVFVASHSGSMLGALLSRGKARGMGFSGLVSVGNEVDLNIGEICLATLDDPNVEGYLLFLESLRDGQSLRRFAIQASKRGKPVYAFKLGRSEAGAEMSATHTGALAGEDDIADAFLKDIGVARVEMLQTLFEIFPLAKKVQGRNPDQLKRIGVVTTTGGGAAMLVDQLGIRDVVVEPASEDTQRRLQEAAIPGTVGRVIDLTMAGTNYDVMKKTLDIMLDAPEFDMVVAVVGSSARFQPDLAVKPIADCSGHTKPLLAMLVPDAPEALARLGHADVPAFNTPESCADAIAAVLKCRSARSEYPAFIAHETAGSPLNEAQAYQLLKQLDVPHAPFALGLLTDPPHSLPFGFPVVAKICSDQLPHKTEVGGVVLNIQNADDLKQACLDIANNLKERAPEIECNQVLFQPQCKGLAEVLLGYRVDPQVGPIVMLAAGGTWAEVMRDRSIRLAPVTEDMAREMIGEVKMLQTLSGLRGKEKGDLDALALAISRLSELALRPDLDILEAEVNPMLVMPEGEGVQAIDALVVVAKS